MSDSSLYPPIEPFFKGRLNVSKIHSLYYEQCGNPQGIPVLFLHGGPGGDTKPRDRQYFDPKAYHIILFHQRGAGQSTPPFCLDENDTWSLVADIEKLREKVEKVERWLIFGGSWGSTLALAYAESHISRVLGLVLRGIFTVRDSELNWTYNEGGAANIYPEEFENFLAPIPPEERNDIVKAYYKRLTGSDHETRLKCAIAWNKWELKISNIQVLSSDLERYEAETQWNLAHARIECHYFINNGFLKTNQLLDNAIIIADSGIPVQIVQGRYDLACPVRTAWDLHCQIPNSSLHIMPLAGHSTLGEGMTEKLVQICDELKLVLKK